MTRPAENLTRDEVQQAAAACAQGCKYRTRDGNLCAIDAPEAVRALERALSRLFTFGSPSLTKITPEAAAGFPGEPGPADVAGHQAWLGVALDREDRLAFAVRYVPAVEMAPAEQNEVASIMLGAALRCIFAEETFDAEEADALGTENNQAQARKGQGR